MASFNISDCTIISSAVINRKITYSASFSAGKIRECACAKLATSASATLQHKTPPKTAPHQNAGPTDAQLRYYPVISQLPISSPDMTYLPLTGWYLAI